MRKQWQNLDWAAFYRRSMLILLIVSSLFLFSTITGIAGHMVMVVFDTFFGSRFSPSAPYVTWAIAGALIGIGPSLWSIPALRKRKLVVLFAPLGLLAIVALGSCFVSVGPKVLPPSPPNQPVPIVVPRGEAGHPAVTNAP